MFLSVGDIFLIIKVPQLEGEREDEISQQILLVKGRGDFSIERSSPSGPLRCTQYHKFGRLKSTDERLNGSHRGGREIKFPPSCIDVEKMNTKLEVSLF